ncbi:AraC family transcriptional regulator [Pedobacter psychrodurus]|uniref:AraC family transcriptional regulator n=1 Tax=Pedobacter psychrodurus TaxID=2530456 RepID=UPI00292D1BD4|nr:AraC family transcriptional regulator [Pedobacter psychrodurus]
MPNSVKESQINILKEQFIHDHVFLYVITGSIRFFNGFEGQTLIAGDYCIIRKNSLVRFEFLESPEVFKPIVFCFDVSFLQAFQLRHNIKRENVPLAGSLVKIKKTDLLVSFIRSLRPYQKGVMQLEDAFSELKHEELIIILLKNNPEFSTFFFDFGIPEKINLEGFMNRNFTFNVSIQRFAFLTGRSLSAFKRDFKKIFNETPGHWLMQKRLTEAYYRLTEQKRRPSEIYLDLGFENLSHFAVAFKKQFGLSPSKLIKQ